MRQINQKLRAQYGLHESNPRFSMDSADLPEMKDWVVGNRYCIVMEVEMTGVQKGDMWGMTENDAEKKELLTGSFKVLAVEEEKEEKEEEMDDSKKYQKDFNSRFGTVMTPPNKGYKPKM